MKCSRIEKLIYLSRELNPDEKTMLSEHLESCQTCAALMASTEILNAGINAISKKEPVPLDADRLTQLVMTRTFSARKTEGNRSKGFRWKLVLGVISMILVFGFFIEFRETPHHPTRQAKASTRHIHPGGSKTLLDKNKHEVTLRGIIESRGLIASNSKTNNNSHESN